VIDVKKRTNLTTAGSMINS